MNRKKVLEIANYLNQNLSLWKYKNLLKTFLMVTTDGHIIDIFGPYSATTSDADIIKHLFYNENSPIRAFFEPNDVFILDRGFRDAIPLLLSLGFNVLKPESVDVGETKLSTIKANKSRMVTNCRWVFEIVNGRFKRDYKIFRSEYFNRLTKYAMDDFKIAGAIINHFHPVITDRNDAHSLLPRALLRFDEPNYLAYYVNEHQLNRHRANFVRIDGQVPALDVFLVMDMSDLVMFSLGTYQIKQARSYYGEHIRDNGTFAIEFNSEVEQANVPEIVLHEALLIYNNIYDFLTTIVGPWAAACSLFSIVGNAWLSSLKIYFTYILLNSSGGNWESAIRQYYCSCVVGKRAMGTCAHVMTIIWYLGWARYQHTVPAASLYDDVLVREDEEHGG